MPHLSKKKVKQDILETLDDQLLTFLAAVHSKRDADVIVRELLSTTERLMLAKRLAIVVMFARGYSFSRIEDMLTVSPDTVLRIWKDFKRNRYQKIVKYARYYTKHFKKQSFINVLEQLAQAGLPPRGRGRWRGLYKDLSA